MPEGILAEIRHRVMRKARRSCPVRKLEPQRPRRYTREWANPSCTYQLSYNVFGSGLRDRTAKRSDQRIRPVACITTNNVTIAITVIESPVNPRQKKA